MMSSFLFFCFLMGANDRRKELLVFGECAAVQLRTVDASAHALQHLRYKSREHFINKFRIDILEIVAVDRSRKAAVADLNAGHHEG